MKKVTLTFPDPKSLWLYKDQSKAVNVSIAPRQNIIAGPFSSEEVEMAVRQFQAVEPNSISMNANASLAKRSETRMSKPLFSFGLSRLVSLLKLSAVVYRVICIR